MILIKCKKNHTANTATARVMLKNFTLTILKEKLVYAKLKATEMKTKVFVATCDKCCLPLTVGDGTYNKDGVWCNPCYDKMVDMAEMEYDRQKENGELND